MIQKIRAFIAIDLPQTVKAELAQTGARLARQLPAGSVRWVKPERMHLTLRFLGDTAVLQLPAIATQLDELTAHHAPFNLHLDKLGCFPNRKRPRVIWAGMAGNENALLALKQDLDERLASLGWEKEGRPYQAHLTLGRVKNSRAVAQVKWRGELEKVGMGVTAVHLIESQLQRSGPLYTIRHTSNLQQTTEN